MQMVKKLSTRWLFLMIGILLIFMPYKSYGNNMLESVYIGEAEPSEDYFIYGDMYYPLYKVKGYPFISLETFKALQWHIQEEEGIYYIMPNEVLPNNANLQENLGEVKNVLNGSAYMAKAPVYCGNIRSYALVSHGQLLLPVEVLNGVYCLRYSDGSYWLEQDFQNELNLLQMSEIGILNQSDHVLQLRLIHLYWNGKSFDQVKEELLLEVGEEKKWTQNEDLETYYITTVVEEINEWSILEATKGMYGQQNEVVFKQYSDSIYLKQLQALFPRCYIKGQMNYSVGPLQEKQTVEIFRSEKHYYYVVKDEKGHKYQVPHGSVRIIGEQGGARWKVSEQAIEDFATLNHIESPTDYLIWTDLCRQRTYVLKKDGEKWKLQKNFVSSTGKANNPTPAGLYQVQYSIPYIGIQKGYRCKYALVFFRDYMFHSILFDKTGQYIKSGQYELGSKASHGCVRLSEKDSEWLYKHIPVKTTVWIR